MFSGSTRANIAQENYLCNVDSEPMNNLLQENNMQCCVHLCGPALRKEITCAMLTHGQQTTFLSKATYTMLCLSSWDKLV